jgi:hypothetical protein
MTQRISDLGEIGITGAMLEPFDLPLLRDGAAWVLSTYTDPRIEVWELRTREAVASPGTIAIQEPATGIVRWTPASANYPSGTYEARIIVKNAATNDEPSGKFRFSIGANAQAP